MNYLKADSIDFTVPMIYIRMKYEQIQKEEEEYARKTEQEERWSQTKDRRIRKQLIFEEEEYARKTEQEER